MSDQPLSQEMIDALLSQGGGDSPADPEPPSLGGGAGAAAPAPEAASEAPAPAFYRTSDAEVGGFTVGGVSFSKPGSPGVESQPSVRPAIFSPLPPSSSLAGSASIDLLLDVPLQVTVELGRTNLSVREVLALGSGSVVELEKLAGEPVDLLVNGRLIARGEVVVIDESFGVRVTEILRPEDGTGLRR